MKSGVNSNKIWRNHKMIYSHENQNLDWKQSWHDKYLHWICGYANASGGVLEIGKYDKTGKVAGLSNPNKLMEDIPNKIRNSMGITPTVDLHEENGDYYIVITTQPYSFPISCNGDYYVRSGATTQQLKGPELDAFILRKQGKTWDSVPLQNVNFEDFEKDAFKAFRRKAIASARMTAEELEISDEELLSKLHMIDGKYIKRAAVLVFHQDPEYWIPGAYLKIGYFENDADILFHDEIHGSLITMADKAEELIYSKYFKGIISYEGLQRVETFPVPRTAFREAILNAIIHRDYNTGSPIQIRVYPDKMLIFNDGKLPDSWTVDDLFTVHKSTPYNPLVAGAFFRSGQVEAWGRGIQKITDSCDLWGKPHPYYKIKTNDVMIGFDTEVVSSVKFGEKFVDEFVEKFVDNNVHQAILSLMVKTPTISAKIISEHIGMTSRGVQKNIDTLKRNGFVERVGSPKGGHWVVKSP